MDRRTIDGFPHLADMARRTVPGERSMAKKPIAKVRMDAKPKPAEPKPKEARGDKWYGKGEKNG
jgi:hypothetical protein